MLACALFFASLSAYSLFSTITLDLTADERLDLCGRSYITERADRFEYAWAAAWTAGPGVLSAAFLVTALLYWRHGRATPARS
jgi:hypothetical protein